MIFIALVSIPVIERASYRDMAQHKGYIYVYIYNIHNFLGIIHCVHAKDHDLTSQVFAAMITISHTHTHTHTRSHLI